jgi:hypothetical protein
VRHPLFLLVAFHARDVLAAVRETYAEAADV